MKFMPYKSNASLSYQSAVGNIFFIEGTELLLSVKALTVILELFTIDKRL